MATLEENISNKISNLDRNELEKKFINLYITHQNLLKKYKGNETEKNLDFSDYQTKRRQQYLHKNYTPHVKTYNSLLKILIETEDENLQNFFNSLEVKLEEKAIEKNDKPRKKKKYK